MYIYGRRKRGRRQGSKLPRAAHQLAESAVDKHAVPIWARARPMGDYDSTRAVCQLGCDSRVRSDDCTDRTGTAT